MAKKNGVTMEIGWVPRVPFWIQFGFKKAMILCKINSLFVSTLIQISHSNTPSRLRIEVSATIAMLTEIG